MNRAILAGQIARRFATAAPKTSTGIEHADAMRKNAGGKPDWSLYKTQEYLHMNKYSYYQSEITMKNDRVPQPTNKKPDVLPKTK